MLHFRWTGDEEAKVGLELAATRRVLEAAEADAPPAEELHVAVDQVCIGGTCPASAFHSGNELVYSGLELSSRTHVKNRGRGSNLAPE